MSHCTYGTWWHAWHVAVLLQSSWGSCGKGFIGVDHLNPLGCPWWQGQCIGPGVGGDRSSWYGHVASWVAESQQVRQDVAHRWMRSYTAGQRRLLAKALPPSWQASPSCLALSTTLLPSWGTLWTINSSCLHIWELLNTENLRGSRLLAGHWGVTGGGTEMKNATCSFQGALSPLRETDKETKTVSCRDEVLDLG